MCKRAQCSSCGKPTFTGCGAHIEQVLADVPKAERCKCKDEAAVGAARSMPDVPSWLKNFFGKM